MVSRHDIRVFHNRLQIDGLPIAGAGINGLLHGNFSVFVVRFVSSCVVRRAYDTRATGSGRPAFRCEATYNVAISSSEDRVTGCKIRKILLPGRAVRALVKRTRSAVGRAAGTAAAPAREHVGAHRPRGGVGVQIRASTRSPRRRGGVRATPQTLHRCARRRAAPPGNIRFP